jgi:hypothetical protein
MASVIEWVAVLVVWIGAAVLVIREHLAARNR